MTAMSRKDREARRMNRAMTRNQDTEECMSCYRISCGCNWRNHQYSGTDIYSAVDPVSDLKAGEGFQKVRERKDSLIF